MIETTDVAIVGAGICGLAIAEGLQKSGTDFRLFEARDRIGGRALTVTDAVTGLQVDLGPSWFWPATQPLTDAVADMVGAGRLAQYDRGAVLVLRDAGAGPETLGDDPIHGGAQRLVGGMAALAQGLARRLDRARLRTGYVLTEIADRGDQVLLSFETESGARHQVAARQAVLAIPPRLLAQSVAFAPALDPALAAAMAGTRTWMAAEAKTVMVWPGAPWRAAGLSGNAFVSHEQAVLAETFDQSGSGGVPGALGGFLALDTGQRTRFAEGLPMLIGSQFAQLFGEGLGAGALHLQDWALEQFTCADADRDDLPAPRRGSGHPLLRRAFWHGRLMLAGTETARRDAGHVEGALDAAARVLRQLGGASQFADLGASDETDPLALLAAWLEEQRQPVFDLYRQKITSRLSRQQSVQLTQLSAVESAEQFLGEALAVLESLPYPAEDLASAEARSALTAQIGAMIKGFLSRLVAEVMAFNRSSCALRNFPDEHTLPEIYIQTILRDITAIGRDFMAEAEDILALRAKRN